MNIFIAFIDNYDQILTAFFSRMGSVIFQDMAGVRGGWPILFFFPSFFLICALFIYAVLPIFVFFEPNLEDMLKITQRTCTLNFVS